MILSMPSGDGQNRVASVGAGGVGVRFTEPFDLTGWTIHRPPYGYGPRISQGSRVLELYDPVDFAAGTIGQPENDTMAVLNERTAADDARERANALEDVDGLLSFKSKR
jgi:hypothetical protein